MNELIPPIRKVLQALSSCQIRFAIGGSFASGLWGNPRQTRDMDVSVFIGPREAARLAELLEEEFMLSRSEIEEAISSTEPYRSFQLVHFESTFKFDMFVRHSSEYDEMVVSHAVIMEVLPGVTAPVFRAEDIVLQKLRWYELGDRISDRQWNDVVQVLEVQSGLLDEAYLERWAKHFGVSELLEEAKNQASG